MTWKDKSWNKEKFAVEVDKNGVYKLEAVCIRKSTLRDVCADIVRRIDSDDFQVEEIELPENL